MGVLWWRYGMIDSAIVQFRNALHHDPRNLAARTNLGGAYVQKGSYNRAIAEYERTLLLAPKDIITLENLGDLYLSQNQKESAILIYQQILTENTDNPLSFLRLGQIYYSMGKRQEAVSLFEKAVTLFSGSLEGLYDSEDAEQDSLYLSKAIAAYNSARIAMPHRLGIYQKLMFSSYFFSLLSNYLHYETPAQRTKRYLALSSKDLARCYYDSGDLVRAKAYYKKVLELGFPLSPETVKNLGLQ